MFKIAKIIELTCKTIVQILESSFLLFPAQPGALGILRIWIVVQSQIVQGLRGLVFPGTIALGIALRDQGLDNPGDVLRRLLRLLQPIFN